MCKEFGAHSQILIDLDLNNLRVGFNLKLMDFLLDPITFPLAIFLHVRFKIL